MIRRLAAVSREWPQTCPISNRYFWVSGRIVHMVSSENQSVHFRETFRSLRPREREILGLIARGRSSKQIAAELDISAHTVVKHRDRILKAFGRHEIVSVVAESVRYGLLTG